MPYICQTCARRKVKCDKVTPACYRCRKAGFDCVYQAPPPRSRKRKLEDFTEKLARYERILQENGLLDFETLQVGDAPLRPQASASHVRPVASKTGKLLTGSGKSRYIDSHMWWNLGDDEIHSMSHDEDEDDEMPTLSVPNVAGAIAPDPLTGAFLGCQQYILQYHPIHADAMQLWKLHAENVEPICKVLHIPSTAQLIDSVSQHPETASKTDECLLFAIYHCAIFSIPAEECMKRFKQDRSTMMQRTLLSVRL